VYPHYLDLQFFHAAFLTGRNIPKRWHTSAIKTSRLRFLRGSHLISTPFPKMDQARRSDDHFRSRYNYVYYACSPHIAYFVHRRASLQTRLQAQPSHVHTCMSFNPMISLYELQRRHSEMPTLPKSYVFTINGPRRLIMLVLSEDVAFSA